MELSEFITPALVLAVGGFLWQEIRRLDGKLERLSADHANLDRRLGRIEGHLLGREALELPAD